MSNILPRQEFMTNGKFDLGEFNTAFEENKQYIKNQTEKNAAIRLDNLLHKDPDYVNSMKNNMYNNLLKFFIEIKNSWFYLIDDLLQFNFNLATFMKSNIMLHIGLTLFAFVAVLMIINQFSNFDDDINSKINSKINSEINSEINSQVIFPIQL